MNWSFNVLKVGATRKGKSLAAAADIIANPGEAVIVLDPHKQSMAETVLTHATGDVLYDQLSEIRPTLGFDMLRGSLHPDSLRRQTINQQRADAFCEILLRRRGSEGLAGTPLIEEWVMALLTLFLFQKKPLPLSILPFGFLPGTEEFTKLVAGCTLPEIRQKFRMLEKLNPKSLRSEVGPASRLINGVFRSVAFQTRCSGGFDLGEFLQKRGKLIVERGDEIGDDAMRVIMGAIVLLTIEHAKGRKDPKPPIRVYIDEATNARLVGAPEMRGLAETSKNGLYWTFMVQNLDFPGGADAVLQNCLRHEWFGCPHYELARKAATDILAGLPSTEESRASRLESLTTEIMGLAPGWRWVRDPKGSRKEYVPMLENPWPNWPGLREEKLRQKIQLIRARPEYGDRYMPPSTSSDGDEATPAPSLAKDSSPADRLKRKGKRPAGGSTSE